MADAAKKKGGISPTLIVLFVFIAVALFLWFYVGKEKLYTFFTGKKFPTPPAINGNTNLPSGSNPNGLSETSVLKKGDSGDQVTILQTYLNQTLGYKGENAIDILPASCDSSTDGGGSYLKEDGIFGTCTETILIHLTGKSIISTKDFYDNYLPNAIEIPDDGTLDVSDNVSLWDVIFGWMN